MEKLCNTPRERNNVIHAEELPAHSPAPTAEQWIAANERRQVAAYANPDASTAFVVEYVAPDGIVINYGKSVVAIYPKPDGTDLHAGDRIVISEGALSLPAEQKKGGTQIKSALSLSTYSYL